MIRFPKVPLHVIPRFDHPAQRTLQMVDESLLLYFNVKLHRYEVWNGSGFIQRVIAPGGGFMEPGEWFMQQLRMVDPRSNPDLDDIVRRHREQADAPTKEKEAALAAKTKEKVGVIVDRYAEDLRRELFDTGNRFTVKGNN